MGELKLPTSRPDVARAFPLINNAANAGFRAGFQANRLNFNHQLQLISRYSGSADGNSDYVDYWFPPLAGPTENLAHLDGFDWSNGHQLKVTGWHANDITRFESNHNLILFDNTAGRQVAVTMSQPVARPDVGRAFPAIATAARSGFSGSFDLTNWHLDPQHQYSVVSRYSTSADPNGNGGGGGGAQGGGRPPRPPPRRIPPARRVPADPPPLRAAVSRRAAFLSVFHYPLPAANAQNSRRIAQKAATFDGERAVRAGRRASHLGRVPGSSFPPAVLSRSLDRRSLGFLQGIKRRGFLCESQPGRCIEGQSYPIGRPSCLRSFSFLEW